MVGRSATTFGCEKMILAFVIAQAIVNALGEEKFDKWTYNPLFYRGTLEKKGITVVITGENKEVEIVAKELHTRTIVKLDELLGDAMIHIKDGNMVLKYHWV